MELYQGCQEVDSSRKQGRAPGEGERGEREKETQGCWEICTLHPSTHPPVLYNWFFLRWWKSHMGESKPPSCNAYRILHTSIRSLEEAYTSIPIGHGTQWESQSLSTYVRCPESSVSKSSFFADKRGHFRFLGGDQLSLHPEKRGYHS